jgi:DNA-binding PucR family transcriptional regulator
LAARLRGRVLDSLSVPGHEELMRTLRTLVRCRCDRSLASAALNVHRNTLAYRLRRIEEITGLDLDNPRDLACAYLAVGMDDEQPEQP